MKWIFLVGCFYSSAFAQTASVMPMADSVMLWSKRLQKPVFGQAVRMLKALK